MTLSTASLKKIAVGTLLISVSSVPMLAQAEVTLLVDDNIKVTAINGQEVKQSIFQPPIKSFTLQPGQHAVTAKYDRLYKLPRDEHDYLRSGNVSITANLADNQTYRLTMPNQPENYEAAKEYAERPTLAIQQNNTIVASQQSMGGNQGGMFSGIGKALGGVFGGSGDAELQNQRAIAAIGQSSSAPVVASRNNANTNTSAVAATTYTAIPAINPTVNPVANTSQSNTLDSFMQVWLQATPSEREKMRQWIQQ